MCRETQRQALSSSSSRDGWLQQHLPLHALLLLMVVLDVQQQQQTLLLLVVVLVAHRPPQALFLPFHPPGQPQRSQQGKRRLAHTPSPASMQGVQVMQQLGQAW